jgi:hypothetical protein
VLAACSVVRDSRLVSAVEKQTGESSVVQLCYFCPEGSCSQASQSHPRVFRTSIALAGPAGFAGTCSPTANLKATESEKWRNARVVRPCIGSGTDSRSSGTGFVGNCTPELYVHAMPRDTGVRQQRPHTLHLNPEHYSRIPVIQTRFQ